MEIRYGNKKEGIKTLVKIHAQTRKRIEKIKQKDKEESEGLSYVVERKLISQKIGKNDC